MKNFNAEEVADFILDSIWDELEKEANIIEDDVIRNYTSFNREDGPDYEGCEAAITEEIKKTALEMAQAKYSGDYTEEEWKEICKEISSYDGYCSMDISSIRDSILYYRYEFPTL